MHCYFVGIVKILSSTIKTINKCCLDFTFYVHSKYGSDKLIIGRRVYHLQYNKRALLFLGFKQQIILYARDT